SESVWTSAWSCSRSSSMTSPGSLTRTWTSAGRPESMLISPLNWPGWWTTTSVSVDPKVRTISIWPFTTTKNGTETAPASTSTSPRSIGRARPCVATRSIWAGVSAGNICSAREGSTPAGTGGVGSVMGGRRSLRSRFRARPDLPSETGAPLPSETGDLLGEDPQRQVDRPQVGAKRERDHAEGEAAVEQRRGEEDPAVLPHRLDDRLVDPVRCLERDARRRPAEGHDREVGRGADREAESLDLAVEIARQEQLFLERRPEGLGPEEDQRQPHAESPKRLRQLGRDVGGGDLARLAQGVLHVVAGVAVGRGERLDVPDHQDAGSPGQEQALVRIEDDRVGALDPGKDAPPMLGQEEETAVGRVDVEPAARARGDRRQGVERIDRPRVRGARRRQDQPGPQALPAIGGDRFFQGLGAHPEALVDRDRADPRLAEPRDAEGLLEAVVGLVGQIDDRRGELRRLEAVGVARRA